MVWRKHGQINVEKKKGKEKWGTFFFIFDKPPVLYNLIKVHDATRITKLFCLVFLHTALYSMTSFKKNYIECSHGILLNRQNVVK